MWKVNEKVDRGYRGIWKKKWGQIECNENNIGRMMEEMGVRMEGTNIQHLFG